MTEMQDALDNFEKFLHEDNAFPALISCGLAHAQFETIHPFMDGNGRMGRLLITFLLMHRGVLRRPLLYLSLFLKRHRSEYYDRLMAVRDVGDWEGWLRFFLRGVAETAEEATRTSRDIITLRAVLRTVLQDNRLRFNAYRLLDLLFQRPVLNISLVKEALDISFSTANNLVEEFETNKLLAETTGGQRNRLYRFTPYLQLFEDQGAAPEDMTPAQITESTS